VLLTDVYLLFSLSAQVPGLDAALTVSGKTPKAVVSDDEEEDRDRWAMMLSKNGLFYYVITKLLSSLHSEIDAEQDAEVEDDADTDDATGLAGSVSTLHTSPPHFLVPVFSLCD